MTLAYVLLNSPYRILAPERLENLPDWAISAMAAVTTASGAWIAWRLVALLRRGPNGPPAEGRPAEAGFAPGYYAGLFGNPILRWSDDQLLALPAAVGATSTPAFAACVTGRSHAGWVDSITAAAAQRGVTSTPTVLVDGAVVDVSKLTPEDLAAMINP